MFSALSQIQRTIFTGTTPLLVSKLIYFFAKQTPETPSPSLTVSLPLSPLPATVCTRGWAYADVITNHLVSIVSKYFKIAILTLCFHYWMQVFGKK